ncbi:hypothetical protein D9758_014937 [Tetrapyrgos nigripes]|uniref:Uncharacterized protein n=1 Tax=Tetrapyrgos nigripes TaxID=182062 RepID=A0A8H5C9H4_9AGAR|nr:hypothetical protein D9758_014937 [Tetrapyrgos nigripes]
MSIAKERVRVLLHSFIQTSLRPIPTISSQCHSGTTNTATVRTEITTMGSSSSSHEKANRKENIWAGGNVFKEEADELKRKFEQEFSGDEEKFYKYRRQAFRWTCCGLDADLDYGCDHHGTGSAPCSCDFCKSGEPLPDYIWNGESISRKGLTLSRGPDPRSFIGFSFNADMNRLFRSLFHGA